jgi:hypothetical protein
LAKPFSPALIPSSFNFLLLRTASREFWFSATPEFYGILFFEHSETTYFICCNQLEFNPPLARHAETPAPIRYRLAEFTEVRIFSPFTEISFP